MFVRSTGLGRTLLSGNIAKIVTTKVIPSTLEMPTNGHKEPMRLLMEMQITNPVNWTVRAFMDPPDVRDMIKHILCNPVLIWQAVKFLFIKGPQYEAVDKKETLAPQAASMKSGPASIPGGAPAKGPGAIPAR
ncbi:MAG: hypothetical protein C0392_13415 [Syntrophus sp. (in: bacteria)]|nr:hypothetical protein [Syntrophus sp. (in: bacteria)]